MSKTKTKQTQTQNQTQNTAFQNQASYGEFKPTDTEDITAFRNFRPQVDPGIAAQYGQERNQLNQSFINPLGGQYSPHVADAIKRSAGRDISARESQAFRQGNYDQNQQRAGQLGSLAALTQGRLVQTGSSGTGSGTSTGNMTGETTQGKNLFGNILDVAQAGASMAMM